jgi:hypothetical protein
LFLGNARLVVETSQVYQQLVMWEILFLLREVAVAVVE